MTGTESQIMLIALSGKKRRGKDTVANYLVEKYGFNKHGFADKVKEYAYAINPLIAVMVPFTGLDPEKSEYAMPTFGRVTFECMFRLQYIVDTIGWERAKEISEVRQLLQRTGTEGGRRIFNPIAPNNTFWIKLLFAELEEKYDYYTSAVNFNTVGPDGETTINLVKNLQSKVVIADLRFDNEAEAVHKHGGVVLLVDSNRPGLPEADGHASEAGVSPSLIDGTLYNNGTLEELYTGVEEMLDFVGFVRTNEVIQRVGN
jgi:hypothetical protein